MKGPDSARLALAHVAKLHAYTPGLQPSGPGWVKLNTNECPYPPSPRVAEAILRARSAAMGASLRLYPDPSEHGPARGGGAASMALAAANVCIGNGSDDILNLLVRCFCGPAAAAAFTAPGYSLYPVLIGIQDGAVTPRSGSTAACACRWRRSPRPGRGCSSSPRRTHRRASGFPTSEIAAILESFEGLLVVDEAYAAVRAGERVPGSSPVIRSSSSCGRSPRPMRSRASGSATRSPTAGVIGLLDRVRDSYNVSRLSQVAALAALGDPELLRRRSSDKIKSTRDLYARQLGGGSGDGSRFHPRRTSSARSPGTRADEPDLRSRRRPTISCSRARCWCATSRATP